MLSSKTQMLFKSFTKVGLKVLVVPIQKYQSGKKKPKAGKNVQQKCHIKLIFMVQRYLGRVGPQPSNLMKEE